jgi:hypothetical protein
MVAIANLTVTNAKRINVTNWVTVRDVFGPQQIPDPSPRGECVVEASTVPLNNEAEWSQIAWRGGEAIHGRHNQRLVKRREAVRTTVTASIGSDMASLVLWTLWAEVSVLTKGPRPPFAKPWSAGTLFPGPDQCGAHEVQSPVMGKNARAQIVAVAKLLPSGIGKILSATGKHTLFNLRREVAAYDFTDGTRQAFKKSSGGWVDDTLQEMQVHTSAATDELYDTDAPDLPTGAQTAETYNNFRQWLEWDRRPCSNYAHWYWQARWKDQQVTLKDVGQGSITLPPHPFYKKP